jgi:hypothetical protein
LEIFGHAYYWSLDLFLLKMWKQLYSSLVDSFSCFLSYKKRYYDSVVTIILIYASFSYYQLHKAHKMDRHPSLCISPHSRFHSITKRNVYFRFNSNSTLWKFLILWFKLELIVELPMYSSWNTQPFFIELNCIWYKFPYLGWN